MPPVPRPCIRLFRHGVTFRWERGDEFMTVHRGNYRDARALAALIDRVPVPKSWDDVTDVRRRANAWLEQAAQHPHKPTVGVGASPTPAPAVPHNVEVPHDADQ